MTGRVLRKENLPEAVVPLERDVKDRADITLMETVRIRHAIIVILPYVRNSKSDRGCKSGEKCVFMHKEFYSQPHKKQEAMVEKVPLLLLKNSKQSGCVFQDVEPPEIQVNSTAGHDILGTSAQRAPHRRYTIRPIKNRERKGPSQGDTQHSEPCERGPHAPNFEERSQEEAMRQERCARRDAWEMVKKYLQTQRKGQSHILLAVRSLAISSAIFDETRGKEKLW